MRQGGTAVQAKGRFSAEYASMNNDFETARINSYPHRRKLAANAIAKAA